MKKVLFAFVAVVTTIALAPLASANSLAVTYSPALTGNNVIVNSNIGSFFETETFTNGTGYAVDIADVTPVVTLHDHDNDGNSLTAGNPNDDVTSVFIVSGEDTCEGADLAAGGYCSLELQVFVNGAAPSRATGDDALSYGDSKISLALDGEGGKRGTTAVNTTGEFVATVDYDPDPASNSDLASTPTAEPRSLVLMGTGFGVLVLVASLRRKRSITHPPAI